MAADTESHTIDFRLPSLGSDMDAGVVLDWRVSPGDRVRKGDVLVEVDTEKSEIEVEVWHAAVVEELLVDVGTEVPVGTPLARLRVDADVARRAGATAAAPASAPVTPAAPPPPRSSPQPTQRPAVVVGAAGSFPDPRLVFWPSPAGSPTGVVHATTPGAATQGSRADRRQAAVAALMDRANREIPHFHVTRRLDVERALRALEERNEHHPPTERVLPAALLLRAVVLALRVHPELNGSWADDAFTPASTVDLGVAVHVRGGGLMTPVIAAAEELDLDALMAALGDAVRRVRRGKLRSGDTAPGSITVTNIGDGGADGLFGVIHPPQVALVGFGRIVEAPVVVEGSVAAHRTMQVTLTADHRALNGHSAAAFLDTLDDLVDSPEVLT